jgi:hypothetical protein
MKTSKFGLSSRLLMLASLLAGLLFSASNVSAGIKPVPITDAIHSASGNVLSIPELANGGTAPKPNGECDQSEYAGGLFVTFADGPSGGGIGEVYLIHTATQLYVCITSPTGSYPTRFDALYLDPQGNGTTYTYAQQDDYSLRLNYTAGKSTFIGNGLQGGWTDVSGADNTLWTGSSSTGTHDGPNMRFR